MGVVGNGDISLQIRGYHLSPAGVATSRRIRIVRALIRHCGVPRNEHRRAFRLLHCNRTDYRSVGDNGDVQRPVLVDLCMPSRHDVADISHHGAGKPFPYVCPVFPAIFCPLRFETALRPRFIGMALPGHIPPVSQMPAPRENQHVPHWPLRTNLHSHPIIPLTGHIQLKGKGNPPMLSLKSRSRPLLEMGDPPIGIQKTAEPILLHKCQLLILIPAGRIESGVQLRHPQALLLPAVLLCDEAVSPARLIEIPSPDTDYVGVLRLCSVAAPQSGSAFRPCFRWNLPENKSSIEHPTAHHPSLWYRTPAKWKGMPA